MPPTMYPSPASAGEVAPDLSGVDGGVRPSCACACSAPHVCRRHTPTWPPPLKRGRKKKAATPVFFPSSVDPLRKWSGCACGPVPLNPPSTSSGRFWGRGIVGKGPPPPIPARPDFRSGIERRAGRRRPFRKAICMERRGYQKKCVVLIFFLDFMDFSCLCSFYRHHRCVRGAGGLPGRDASSAHRAAARIRPERNRGRGLRRRGRAVRNKE